MLAKSKKQQVAAGAALAAKQGKQSSLRDASRQMAKSMSKKQLREFAKTKRKKLPTKRRRKR